MRVQVAALQQEIARLQEGGAPTMSFAPESKGEAREEAKRALAAAQSAAESLLHEARAKADQVIAEAEAKVSDAQRRAAEAERDAAARARSIDPSSATAVDDLQARVHELERQELEIRERLRDMLEDQISVLDRSEAQSHQAATVQRMSRELSDGTDEPEPNPRRFWTEPPG